MFLAAFLLSPSLALAILPGTTPRWSPQESPPNSVATKPVPKARPPGLATDWHAWLESPGGHLPFGLRFRTEDGVLRATIHNGEEIIEVPKVALDDTRLSLRFDHYDSVISCRLGADRKTLEGTWAKRRGEGRVARMDFHATAGQRPRFTRKAAGAPDGERGAAPAIEGRWRVKFASDKHPSVGIFRHGRGSTVTGTFLTTLGDYRFLAGNRYGKRLALSCFDGAHAFLFRARLDAEGRLIGDFWSGSTWHENWRGERDAQAALPDAWRLTKADARHLGRLKFPDLNGRLRSLTDPEWAGRARVLIVFGTWCPNCKDATSVWAELYRRYRKQGLSVVGLAFEHTGDRERDSAQLRIYRERQGITYPLLLAGLSDKKKASQALPILDAVRSYPTTIFLTAEGKVHAVHTGFTGPGAPEEHRKLRLRFETLIRELLRR